MQVAFRQILKKLIPMNLYSNPREYREALEEYLKEHAENFIQNIGENTWLSLFAEKLLPEVHRRFFLQNTSSNFYKI